MPNHRFFLEKVEPLWPSIRLEYSKVSSAHINDKKGVREMSIKLSILGVLVVSALILGGCGQTKAQEVSVDVSCDDFSEVQSISQEAQVPVGGLLVMTLCSNPTTGFKWESAEISDQTVLKETSHKFASLEEDKAPSRVGTAGAEVWTFRALKAGNSTISVAYSRPWEGGEKAVWTYDLYVVVK